MPITIAIYGSLVIFMVNISYYNPAYINSLFPETDLLISVGDNIDRGPESLDVLRLLNQPWFISVKGNHEAMALDAFATGDGNMWLASGGDWFFDLNDSEQKKLQICC